MSVWVGWVVELVFMAPGTWEEATLIGWVPGHEIFFLFLSSGLSLCPFVPFSISLIFDKGQSFDILEDRSTFATWSWKPEYHVRLPPACAS